MATNSTLNRLLRSELLRSGTFIAVAVAVATGLTGVASAVEVASPEELGPWKLGFQHIDPVDSSRADRPVPLDIWYPVDPEDWTGPSFTYDLLAGAGPASALIKENADVSDQPGRSLIIFSHGFGGIALQSTPLCEYLASHGFVVASITHTGNTQSDMSDPTPDLSRSPDVTFAIDTIAAKAADSLDPFYGRVRTDRVGVAGHSFGGLTAMMMASGYASFSPDTRVKAIFPVAASSSPLSDAQIESITIPTFFLVGTLDSLQAETIRSYNLMTGVGAADLYRADVYRANHEHFANVCQIGNWLISGGFAIEDWPGIGAGALVPIYLSTCIPPALPQAVPTRVQNLYAAAFFNHYLNSRWGNWPVLTQTYAEQSMPFAAFFGEIGLPVPTLPAAGHRIALFGALVASGAILLVRRRAC